MHINELALSKFMTNNKSFNWFSISFITIKKGLHVLCVKSEKIYRTVLEDDRRKKNSKARAGFEPGILGSAAQRSNHLTIGAAAW